MPFDYQMVTFEEIIKNDFFKWTQVFKFRKWFKYGLMAQKFQKQHALKGQKLLAQGSALGIRAISKAPCKGKSFKTPGYNIKLLPLQGDRFASKTPQGAALG